MAEAAQQIQSANNMAIVKGRIDQVRLHDGRHMHVVLLPAVDEFSKPQAVEVRSNRRLGEPGSDLQCRGRLMGFTRQFNTRDGGRGTSVTSWVEVE